MKKINYPLVLLVIAFFLFITSCGKDGAVGPQGNTGATGSTGPTGAVGPAGPAGANGQAGSVIYSGTSTPSATLGVTGDFYINLSTGLLYGPKTASGWGTGFSLKGPAGATGATGATGAAGAAGSKILSGTGIPAASLGATGDYYLDKTSYFLYGPKISTGWGAPVSLQGPAGTANVQYSGWNYATNFRDTTVDNSKIKAADLAAPSLTSTIIQSGSIQIYFTFGAGVFALPYTSYAGGLQNTISYIPTVGRFIITRFTADNSGSVPLSTVLQYRYILIPGGQNIGLNNHVNLNNYEAVRKFYRIPD